MRAGKEGPAIHPRPRGLTAVVQAPPCAIPPSLAHFRLMLWVLLSLSLSCLYASLSLGPYLFQALSQSVSSYISYCLPLSCSLHLSISHFLQLLSFPLSPRFPLNLPVRDFRKHSPQVPALKRRGGGGGVGWEEGHGPRPLTFRRDHEIWANLCGCKPSGSHPRSPFLRVHYHRCAGPAARLL